MAAANRRAILDSAHRLFAEHGFQVPLNSIARDAGVGQGVLYRHFPTRMDLALAIFDENLDALECTARDARDDDTDGSGFVRVWRHLLELTLSDTAFVEVAAQARATRPATEAGDRLTAMISPLLEGARASGRIGSGVTMDVLFIALRATYGVVATSADDASARHETAILVGRLGLPEPATGRPRPPGPIGIDAGTVTTPSS